MSKKKPTPPEELPTVLPALSLPAELTIPSRNQLASGKPVTPAELASLAREVAMDIRELPAILKLYNLTEEDYKEICLIPFYARALEVSLIEWNSALSTHERIKVEAAAALEDALPGLSARMKNRDEAFPAAIEAGKLFAKIAGLDATSKNDAAPGEKFTININLGADTKLRYEKDVTPIIPVIEKDKTNE